MAKPPGRIIAIASGKGGVGKTWLAITLAHVLARTGRKVLLFDGDIGLANVDVQLGLAPRRDLSEVFFANATLKEVITPFAPNLDIVAGRSGTTSLATLPAPRLMTVKEQLTALSDSYDFILIDLGAGVEEHVRTLASVARTCIVVATDEPTSLTDAYAFIKLHYKSSPFSDVRIVINQAATLKEGKKTFDTINKACSSFLGSQQKLLGIVRKDGKVRDAIRHQTSIVTRAPHSTAASDVAGIAIKLMQD